MRPDDLLALLAAGLAGAAVTFGAYALLVALAERGQGAARRRRREEIQTAISRRARVETHRPSLGRGD